MLGGMPEKLYQLVAADKGSTGPRRFTRTLSPAAAAAVQITDEWINDTQQILVLSLVTGVAVPGAAQKLARAAASVTDAAGVQFQRLMAEWYEPTLQTAAQTIYQWKRIDGTLFVFPGEKVSMAYAFSAAGAANSASITFSGILIPRGTLN